MARCSSHKAKPTDAVKPEAPTKPTDSATPEKPADESQSPQTGDNGMLGLWIALLFVGSAGVIGVAVYSRKRKSMK